MAYPCPRCGAPTFRLGDKAMAGKWNKKKCSNCGVNVHLNANWAGLIGALGSVLPIISAVVALAYGSWLVFWIGIALILAGAGLAVRAAPLVADSD